MAGRALLPVSFCQASQPSQNERLKNENERLKNENENESEERE